MAHPIPLVLLAWILSSAPSFTPPAPGPEAPQDETGFATYYAGFFHGRRTASGTRFDSTMMLAAHPTLPFGTTVRVHDLRSGSSVVVVVVDRGPAAGPRQRGVVIDLSRAAAQYLGFLTSGRRRVRLEVLEYRTATLPGGR